MRVTRNLVLLAAVAGILVAPLALALDTERGFRKSVEMAHSDYGHEMDAKGYATIQRKGGVDLFEVQVWADLPDGTLLKVTATNRDGVLISVGTVEMFLGAGRLTLQSDQDKSPVFPVAKLRTTMVSEGRLELLNGRF